jgi:hypothetical protein
LAGFFFDGTLRVLIGWILDDFSGGDICFGEGWGFVKFTKSFLRKSTKIQIAH